VRAAEEEQAFAEFYSASFPRLLRALVVVTGSLAEAEDVLQEAYVRAAARWQSLDDPEPWVRVVAINLARDGHRRWRSRQRAEDRLGPPPAVPPPDEGWSEVLVAMRSLPLPQREALALHYLFDLTVEQVAAELRRPAGTVKAQLSRGRARLAELLETEGVRHGR
jgi:RNA polymerase sigma-70 factor (ECF subfamily)